MKPLLSLVTLACFGFLLSGNEQQQSGPHWLDDIDAAVKLAAETDRPLLLVFR